jgi:hypothetical protein
MLRLVLLGLLLVSALRGQTTGVVGVNDLTAYFPPGFTTAGSATTSCNSLGFVGGAPFTAFFLHDAGVTATTSVLMLSFWGCTGAGLGLTPSAAAGCAGPLAGLPLTNLWFSLPLAPPPIPWTGLGTVSGYTRFALPVPPGPGTVWLQAVAIDPCSPYGFKFSQAHDFSW